MNQRFSEELFLTNATGAYLFHRYAEQMPIIDYHCHLQPREIFEDRPFADLGEMWLAGDHYKWRCMRTFGIDEKYITGSASYQEKFMAFAGILPQMVGNPVYIWCALELKRYFGIAEPLGPDNAKRISPRWCLQHSNVRLLETTEDPVDDLRWHIALRNEGFTPRVLTAFRPDKAMFLQSSEFASYIQQLSQAAGLSIFSFSDLLCALEKRLLYFQGITGTTVSDDGIPYFAWENYTPAEIEAIFAKACHRDVLTSKEVNQYQSAFLFEMARLYHRHHYVMQLHIGTYLDANTRKVQEIGQSTGFDCTDDATQVKSVGELLNRLTIVGELPKTILYPLDGTKVESWAVLAAGFCDSDAKAKVQLGASWWFNDQVYGIQRQFEACANLYPLSLSVGMLTDSRSFLSYPRHELYRRVLCNYLGTLVERGEYFSGEEALKTIIEDICYHNVNDFFGFDI